MEEKRKILNSMLHIASIKARWDDKILSEASLHAGYPKEFATLLFPEKSLEVLRFLHETLDEIMYQSFKHAEQVENQIMRLHQKIHFMIMTRLNSFIEYKSAIVAGLKTAHITSRAQIIYKTVDKIWYDVGDKSLDINYYTKRLILLGVYRATLWYWYNDSSTNHFKTSEFLEYNLEKVVQFGKFKKKIKEYLYNL